MTTQTVNYEEQHEYEIYNTHTEEVGWTQMMTKSEAQEKNDVLRGKDSPSRWLQLADLDAELDEDDYGAMESEQNFEDALLRIHRLTPATTTRAARAAPVDDRSARHE